MPSGALDAIGDQMSDERLMTEYEQLQAHAALVARRILRTGENFSPNDIEQLARAWSLQAGEEIRANERLASAMAENADLRERLAAADAMMRELIGWLSADIPELHRVEVTRLAASLNRFLAARAKVKARIAAARAKAVKWLNKEK